MVKHRFRDRFFDTLSGKRFREAGGVSLVTPLGRVGTGALGLGKFLFGTPRRALTTSLVSPVALGIGKVLGVKRIIKFFDPVGRIKFGEKVGRVALDPKLLFLKKGTVADLPIDFSKTPSELRGGEELFSRIRGAGVIPPAGMSVAPIPEPEGRGIPPSVIGLGAGLAGLLAGLLVDRGKSKKEVILQEPPLGISPISAIAQPLGAVKPTEKPAEELKAPKRMPSIRIINKPEINIRFSKSRSFINQQLLVK